MLSVSIHDIHHCDYDYSILFSEGDWFDLSLIRLVCILSFYLSFDFITSMYTICLTPSHPLSFFLPLSLTLFFVSLFLSLSLTLTHTCTRTPSLSHWYFQRWSLKPCSTRPQHRATSSEQVNPSIYLILSSLHLILLLSWISFVVYILLLFHYLPSSS